MQAIKNGLFLGLLALSIAILASNANALTPGETIVMSWDVPMQRVDGTPIDQNELDYYTVICNGFNTGNAESILTLPANGDGSAREVQRKELFMSYGHYKCRIKVTDIEGVDGLWSEYVEVNWRDAEPSAVNVMIVVDSN